MATVLCRLPHGCILHSVSTPPAEAAYDSIGFTPAAEFKTLELNRGVNDNVPDSLVELWAKRAPMSGLNFEKLGEDASGPVYSVTHSPEGILFRALRSNIVIPAR